ncbi:MAG TPA: SpoIIE family protein phosphatase [Thermoleophilia bacterium]|nr:SpoIIE family protein phosphatase [Thermoleophilia bacterium]
MQVTGATAAHTADQERQSRLFSVVTRLRRHPVACAAAGAAGIVAVFFLDMSVTGVFLSGLYMIPLLFLAVSLNWRPVAFAAALCIALSALVFTREGSFDRDHWLILVYAALIGCALVALAYVIRRLSTTTEYAVLRAQLSEAGADILGGGRSRHDLDEFLEFALERLGEQLDATSGILVLLEQGEWVGRAGFGLGLDAREVVARYEDLAPAAQATQTDHPVLRDFTGADPAPLAPLAAHVRLEWVLVVPMRSLEREVGALVFNRPQEAGEYSREQVTLAEGLARYVGTTTDNVRLVNELSTRRRDLELVRDSSLDFAQSIDMDEVLDAVATRLIAALDMRACEIYEVDLDAEVIRNLVTYEDGAPDQEEWIGKDYALDYFAITSMAVRSRRPVLVTSQEDPRLNDVERDILRRYGYRTQLSIPLRIREQVTAVVELFDAESREFSDEEIELARSICRFAALAIDKARLFDRQRDTAERRDRLARRLQRLQSFAVDLNQRLDRADLQEVLDEVTRAAVDLLHVRTAAVVAGSGDYLAVRSLAVAGPTPEGALAAAEADLLERCAPKMMAPSEHFAGADSITVTPGDDDTMLFASLEGEAAPPPSVLVVSDKQQGEFDAEDRMLLSTLAAQLNASMHNAIAYQREHVIAETFQQALLMDAPPIPGIEVGVHYKAATDSARVGGDFYDLVSLGPGKLMVIVGDVCGKSLAAAAQSAVVRYMLRAYAAESSPGEALSRLNSAVITQTPNQPFVTLVVAYVDVARHMFEYACAGHPRPLVLAGLGEFPMPGEGNVPVGIFRGATYPTNRAVLPDDSCVVLFTDGLTDARRDGVLFGEERLREAVRANLPLDAQPLADTLLETVREYAGGILADDCAVVTIKLP